MEEDLFTQASQSSGSGPRPLSEKARPQTMDDFVGQTEVLNSGLRLRDLVVTDQVPSLILWGPPGCGKTSLAHLISKMTKSEFINRSAIDTGAKDLREIGEQAKKRWAYQSKRTVLFVDEIHRLNRAQQDCLLPFVEKGDLTLIGATTENPSFEVNSALLSRSQVIVFKSLSDDELKQILNRALKFLDEDLDWNRISAETDASELIPKYSQGDARRALNYLEQIHRNFLLAGKRPLSRDSILKIIQTSPAYYDKGGDAHYNLISAFIKSIRGSDPDAALFYMARMLEGGEDPLFIARRLVISASEDIGNAEPRALMMAISTKDAVEFVGLPEAAICLAQAVTFLASSPKSNRSYMGFKKAQELARTNPQLMPPMNILNAPTKLMKELGYGGDYEYDHDSPQGISKQSFLPKEIADEQIYVPIEKGSEKNLKAYLDWVKNIRSKLK